LVPHTTLNGVIAFILRYFTYLIALEADNVTVVEDRPIMSVKYRLAEDYPSYLWPKLIHSAVARSLCGSYVSCLFTYSVRPKVILIVLTMKAV